MKVSQYSIRKVQPVKFLVLSSALCLTALTLATLPAQAQFVSIPVTNGTFAITKSAAGVRSYSVLPTFLSPAGTLTITGANANSAFYDSPTPVTTNTPAGFADTGGYSGSATLTDGRTAAFTNAGAALRGTATITGAQASPQATLTVSLVFCQLGQPSPTRCSRGQSTFPLPVSVLIHRRSSPFRSLAAALP